MESKMGQCGPLNSEKYFEEVLNSGIKNAGAVEK